MSDQGIRKWIEGNADNFQKAFGGTSTRILDDGFALLIMKGEDARMSLRLDLRHYHPTRHLLGGHDWGSGEWSIGIVPPGGRYGEHIHEGKFNQIEILPEGYGIRLKQVDRLHKMEAYIDPNFRVTSSIIPSVGDQN